MRPAYHNTTLADLGRLAGEARRCNGDAAASVNGWTMRVWAGSWRMPSCMDCWGRWHPGWYILAIILVLILDDLPRAAAMSCAAQPVSWLPEHYHI